MGNVELRLHDWNIDFAAWCSYKYLNSGPGGTAGIFVHRRHDDNEKLTVLRGWWGHEKASRFLMTNKLEPIVGAKGFQLSNPSVLSMTALLGSLRVFSQTSMGAIRQKSALLSAYLRVLLLEGEGGREAADGSLKGITPLDPHESGAQLSVLLPRGGAEPLQQYCEAHGVLFDVRKPDMIRLAPTGLYNTFADVLKAARVIKEGVAQIATKK